jgi:hypothetical protein
MLNRLLLDASQVPLLRQVVQEGNVTVLERQDFYALTVGGLLELVCAQTRWLEEKNSVGLSFFERCAARFALLQATHRQLIDARGSGAQFRWLPEDGAIVIRVVSHRAAFDDELEYSEFQQAFVRRLKSCGFNAGFATALSSLMAEIVENVPDHSAPEGVEMSPALIGYHTQPGVVDLSVMDLGRGVLASLRENPKWAWLSNSREAIMATLEKGATRLTFHATGGGFRQAIKSVVDRNGLMRVASGDGAAIVIAVRQGRQVTGELAPWLPGMRVTLSFSLLGEPKEIPIPA